MKLKKANRSTHLFSQSRRSVSQSTRLSRTWLFIKKKLRKSSSNCLKISPLFLAQKLHQKFLKAPWSRAVVETSEMKLRKTNNFTYLFSDSRGTRFAWLQNKIRIKTGKRYTKTYFSSTGLFGNQ